MPNKIGSNVVAPFERVKDVNVIMTILHPQPLVGLGNLLLVNKVDKPATLNTTTATPAVAPANAVTGAGTSGDTTPKDAQDNKDKTQGSNTTGDRAFSNELSNDDRMNGLLKRKVDTATGAVYREYKNLDAVAVDYPENSPVWFKANSYFAQSNHSDRIAILDYVDGKLLDTLKDFWYYNWTFMAFVDNTINDDVILASNICESNQDHFLVLQSNDLAQFTQFYGQNYTIGLKHDLSEAMDTALVGAVATKTVGSCTWKFKELEGITPEDLTTQERAGIENSHCIAYIQVDGRNETAEGFSMSGEYIDLLHGEIWVKVNVGNELQRLLQENDKVPYDATGISMVSARINYVLDLAWKQGIIQTNDDTSKGMYEVTTTPRSAQSRDDLSKRHYGGASFTYHASSAIHSLTIHGTVDSDTIMQ